MSRGKKKSDRLAYDALHELMGRPGKPEHALLEILSSVAGRGMVPPDFPEYDDRGVAIVLGSLLESALELAVTSHFIIAPDAARRLFSYPDGPLSEFAAKIAIGYALGVYDEKMRDDLRWLKDIRNAFAHVRFAIDFQTPEIRDACSQLIFPGSMAVTHEGTKTITARQQFTLCAGMLTTICHTQPKGPARLVSTPTYRSLYGPRHT